MNEGEYGFLIVEQQKNEWEISIDPMISVLCREVSELEPHGC